MCILRRGWRSKSGNFFWWWATMGLRGTTNSETPQMSKAQAAPLQLRTLLLLLSVFPKMHQALSKLTPNLPIFFYPTQVPPPTPQVILKYFTTIYNSLLRVWGSAVSTSISFTVRVSEKRFYSYTINNKDNVMTLLTIKTM